MRYCLICCEIFCREICTIVARSPHVVDLVFLPKGLHDLGCQGMQQRLGAALAGIDESRYDAILLGYGLCNNGLLNLRARSIPLVLPRAHDCITLFFGSRQRYKEYFDSHPGTYFLTSGWLERGNYGGDNELSQLSIQHQTGMDQGYAALVEKYGEENARYIWETLAPTRNYGRYLYLDMGVEPAAQHLAQAQERAREKGWEFEQQPGDWRLLEALVAGGWSDAEFLVVQPGQQIAGAYDHERIVKAVPAEPQP